VTQPKTPNRDPLIDLIEAAPIDEEPLSDEERLELAETKKRGRFITTSALKARLAERINKT
jgi:hypothetical protein